MSAHSPVRHHFNLLHYFQQFCHETAKIQQKQEVINMGRMEEKRWITT
jgi:hypothetical protein